MLKQTDLVIQTCPIQTIVEFNACHKNELNLDKGKERKSNNKLAIDVTHKMPHRGKIPD